MFWVCTKGLRTNRTEEPQLYIVFDGNKDNFTKKKHVFPGCEYVTSAGELLVSAGRELLEEVLEDDELTDILAFLSAVACKMQMCET